MYKTLFESQFKTDQSSSKMAVSSSDLTIHYINETLLSLQIIFIQKSLIACKKNKYITYLHFLTLNHCTIKLPIQNLLRRLSILGHFSKKLAFLLVHRRRISGSLKRMLSFPTILQSCIININNYVYFFFYHFWFVQNFFRI